MPAGVIFRRTDKSAAVAGPLSRIALATWSRVRSGSFFFTTEVLRKYPDIAT